MTEIPQWQQLLRMFHEHGNVLHSGDFRDTPLYNEWRRAKCDMKDRGFNIQSKMITRKVWEYTLIESQPELLKVA